MNIELSGRIVGGHSVESRRSAKLILVKENDCPLHAAVIFCLWVDDKYKGTYFVSIPYPPGPNRTIHFQIKCVDFGDFSADSVGLQPYGKKDWLEEAYVAQHRLEPARPEIMYPFH